MRSTTRTVDRMTDATNHRLRTRPALEGVVSYKPGRPPQQADGVDAFKMSSNENPYPPLPSVINVINHAVAHLNRYPGMDMHDLRTALATRWDVSPDHIIPGAGSSGVLQQLVTATVETGKEVIYAWRSFEMYPILIALAGGRSVQIPLLADGRHDLEAMAAAITPETSLILLCTPNNPTGPIITHREAIDFLERVPSDVLVAIDEAYIEFNRDPAAIDSSALLRKYPNVIILRTFSKAYGLAGLRIGYAVVSPASADTLTKTRLPFVVTDIAHDAAVASLAADEELTERVDTIVAERERVEAALIDMGWKFPHSEANFVWLPLGNATEAFVAACEAAHLTVRPFAGEGVRVSIDIPQANDTFLTVARQFADQGLLPTDASTPITRTN
ncbi:Putative phenylalanine aminotransferase [Dermatophilus congolensis]|uniref:Aromatic amino acid aminotransferase n=2 Tax=Dermatophilus congolensis TaxID=1863 RepID=A0AA46BQA4_9MICO|nr:Putative phenylalanine aminotransferase [Dermatophilus congolensis]